jgi:hypothetical protein
MSLRIPAVFMAAVLQTLATLFGGLLFLVPAVWVSAVLFAVIPVVVLEKRGPYRSFDRSAEISKGVKGHVLSTLGLVIAILIVAWIGGVIIAQLVPTPQLQVTVGALVEIIVYPLYGIATTLLYYDIRIRKEGFDIEMMARQAVPSSTPASAVSA